jgi:DNA-binding CsgD family transcriptional regulator
LDSSGYELFTAYHRELGPSGDPIFQALGHVPGQVVTRARRELVADDAWYRSAAWEYRRPIGIDEQLTSVYQVSGDGAVSVIAVHREASKREFSARQQRLMSFFHAELGRLIGHALVSTVEPGSGKLSPRLRQTLACLLDGDSEKQLAARVGLSQATVHQYVTALYRHFGVSSRAQLLALAIKRIARAGWGSLPTGGSPSPRD